uniref:leucine-rich repeat protein n=3 Tax=Flavobacterium sp. TaxID=239 RepID=UPI00404A14A4
MKLKLYLFVLVLLTQLISYGQSFNAGGLNYVVTSDTEPYTVAVGTHTNANGLVNVTIPETVESSGITYSVTSIGAEAFQQCTNITTVSMGNSITSIGNYAFSVCVGLTSLSISNSVTSIGNGAFRYTALNSIDIPNSVTSIGLMAFEASSSLTAVTLSNSLTSLGYGAFYDCTSLTSIILPNTLTTIESYTFHNCSALTSVTMPNALTSIGGSAFALCAGLNSISLPNSLVTIGQNAFDYCAGLTSLNIPNSVASFGIRVFRGCIGLTSVTVNWTTPFVLPNFLNGSIFQGVTTSNIILNVPAGTTAAYQAAAIWQGFNIPNPPATHLNFDGTSDYVTLPNESNFDFTNQMTVEFWMNSNTAPQQWDGLVTKGDDSWRVALTESGTVAFAGTGAFSDFYSTTSVTDGIWHHVAVTYNGSNAIIYIDGVQESSLSATGNISNSNFAVAIGENLQPTGRFYTGNMDEVRIWNTAKTASQINNAKNCELQGDETGLVAYYKFNQGFNNSNNGSETSLIDATANGNNGTLNSGFALSGTTSNFVSGSVVTAGSTIPSAPTASAQTLSNGSTVADLLPASNETILWYDVATGGTALTSDVALSTGTYYVSQVNENGCESERTEVAIVVEDVLTLTAASQTNNVCFGGETGTATVNEPTNGTAPFTYDWTGDPIGDGTTSISELSAGTYVCTVTDALSNTASQSFTITQPVVLQLNPASQTNNTCLGNATGTATVNEATGGTAPYTYDWTGDSTGDGTTTISDLAAGTYTCTVTDANGCTASTQFTITNYLVGPTITANDSEIICAGASITLSPTTGSQSTTNGFVDDFAVTNWTQTSNYSNGSIVFDDTNVVMVSSDLDVATGLGYNQVTATIPSNTTISFDWSYITTDGAYYDYPQLFLNNNLTVFNGFNNTFGGANSQSGSQTIQLQSGDVFGFRMVTIDNLNGSATVTISNFQVLSENQYAWEATNGGVIDGATNTLNLTVDTTGTYTLTVTNGDGCMATKSIAVVNGTALPTAENTQSFTYAATISDLEATGTDLQWYDVATDGTALATNTVLSTGTYYVSQTLDGCESERTEVSVTINLATEAPTTTFSTQIFAGDDKTVADLQITGSNIIWYDAANEGNVLTNTTILVDETTYYASQTIEGLESENRVAITVNRISEETQTLVTGSTVADLVATPTSGTSAQWFASSTSEDALQNTTVLVEGSYFVEQMNQDISVSSLTGTTQGFSDGDALTAQFSQPYNMDFDADGNMYVADYINNRIRKVTTSGVVTTLAGTTTSGFVDGNGANASFNKPTDLVVDKVAGFIYVTDANNDAIRKISLTGDVTTITAGLSGGFEDGDLNNARFDYPSGIVRDLTGNLYISDQNNNRIRKISLSGNVTTIAGNGIDASVEGTGPDASLSAPQGIDFDSEGNLYVIEYNSFNLRKITTTGVVSTVVNGVDAGFNYPTGLAIDSQNNILIADTDNSLIKKVTPNGNVSVFAGSTFGFADGAASNAQFKYPIGIAINNSGEIFVADTYNHKIRKITSDAAVTTNRVEVAVVLEDALTLTAASQTNVSCNGTATGSATVNEPTNGTAPYTYDWTGDPIGDGTTTISELSAGTYVCTVTDALGNTATQSFTITQPFGLVAFGNVHQPISCFGGNDGGASIQAFGGVEPYTYQWSSGQTTAIIPTGLTAGLYQGTVTDANGCSEQINVLLENPEPFEATIVVNNHVSCFGGSNAVATVNINEDEETVTYLWSNGQTSKTIFGLIAGNYSVNVTFENGCVVTSSVIITQPALLQITPASQTNIACFGTATGSITLNPATGGTAPYTYDWTGNPTGDGTTTISGLTAGTYACTVTDAKGCTVSSQTFGITQPAILTASATVSSTLSCNNDSDAQVVASVTGGQDPYFYEWNTGGTNALEVNLSAGTYSVTITDANGCTAQASVTVENPELFVATGVVNNHVSCPGGNDGSATINTIGDPGSGLEAFTNYEWSNGATTKTVTALSAGTYTVNVTSIDGCLSTTSVTITEPAPFSGVVVSQTNVSCFGGSNGSAIVEVSGGSGEYTYQWSNGSTAPSISGLTAGVYNLYVTDSNGCGIVPGLGIGTTVATITITQPALLQITPASQTNIACFGTATGSITLNPATGGTAPYTYDWTGNPTGDGTTTISGLTAGTYSCTVTDAKGCTVSSQTFGITQPAILTASATVASPLDCNNDSDGQVVASLTGGTWPFTYEWNTGATDVHLYDLSAGTYSVIITDANGCTAQASVTIENPELFVATGVVNNHVSCFGGNDGSATANINEDEFMISYAWSNGATTKTVTGLSAGTYTVNVTSIDGCLATTSVTITEPAPFAGVVVSQTNVTCYDGFDGGATVVVSGGSGEYIYQWSNGQNTPTLSEASAGVYNLYVTDSNGCGIVPGLGVGTTVATVTITEPDLLSIPSGDPMQTFYQGETLADLEVSGSNLIWYSNEDGNSTLDESTLLESGETYYVSQVNENGCESERLEINVEVNLPGISPEFCGSTLENVFYEPIVAEVYPGATQYEFKLTYDGDSMTAISTTNQIVITEFGGSFGFDYGATYDVEVRVMVAGAWSPYSSECQFSIVDLPL